MLLNEPRMQHQTAPVGNRPPTDAVAAWPAALAGSHLVRLLGAPP